MEVERLGSPTRLPARFKVEVFIIAPNSCYLSDSVGPRPRHWYRSAAQLNMYVNRLKFKIHVKDFLVARA